MASNYGDGYLTPLLGNSTHGGYTCCYDCPESCKDSPRRYQGWQCCQKDNLQTEGMVRSQF